MGRPTKHGLDYFYVVCDPEDKIEYLEAKHGIVGYGVLVKLWRRIYKLHGYWCEWDERAQFLFAKEVGIPVDQVLEIVETCFKENIFSRVKYEELFILTSSGTQKFFLEVCRLAKRKNSTIDVNHSLPIKTPEETKKTPEKSGGNPSKSQNNPEESAQSKVKESKVKESREARATVFFKKNERKEEKCTGPKFSEILEFFESQVKDNWKQNKISIESQKFFNHYEAMGWKIRGHKIEVWQAKANEWIIKEIQSS